MKVTSIERVPLQPVQMEGTRGARMRVMLGEADGAPGFTMRLFELEPEGFTPRHSHPHEHEIIVQSGSGTLWSREAEHPLEPGVVALVGPDEEHQLRAGSKGMAFFCIVPNEGHG
jgi:quercetin dioxygenase-like cupin family protein